jgi:hypothetical protein
MLLKVWGLCHLHACGGLLRTSHRAATRRESCTVNQCKNHVDYLKKRCRGERRKPKGAPPPPWWVSGWMNCLRSLLGLAPSAPLGFTKCREDFTTPPEVKEDDDDNEKEENVESSLPRCWSLVAKRQRMAVSLLSPVTASSVVHPDDKGRNCAEVATTLDMLTGMYEQVEAVKQRGSHGLRNDT